MTDTGPHAVQRSSLLLVAWCLAVLLAMAAVLGANALFEPDEGRNAEVAREMAARDDYIVPHLNGLPYLDKPALYFAADAVSQRLLGANEFAARFPSLLFALATALLVAWFAGRLYGPAGAWTAGLATLCAPLSVAFARIVIFDTALAFFVVLADVAFFMAIEARRAADTGEAALAQAHAAGRWATLAWAAVGLGVLTKGPVAILLPLLVALPYAAWRRAMRAVWRPLGLAVFAAVVAAWVWPVSSRLPELLHYALVVETFERVATPALHRTGPIWVYIPILLIGLLPWSVVVLAGLRRPTLRDAAGKLDPRAVYFILWVGLPFVFFSLSQSKRIQYVLPLVPAVALLVAHAWAGDRASLPGVAAAGWTLAGLGALLVVVGVMPPERLHTPEGLGSSAAATALSLGLAFLASGVASWLTRRRRELALVSLSFAIVAFTLIVTPLLAAVAAQRSSRDLARAVETQVGRDGEVVAIDTYPQSLSFYLRRTIPVCTENGRELTSNYIAAYYDKWRVAPDTTLRPLGWWRDALADCRRPTVFVAAARNHAVTEVLAARLPLIASAGGRVAYGPCRVLAGPDGEGR